MPSTPRTARGPHKPDELSMSLPMIRKSGLTSSQTALGGIAAILTDRSTIMPLTERTKRSSDKKYNLYGSFDNEGIFDDDVYTHLIGTQEIMLFYFTSLLKSLVTDSSKVIF